MADVISHDTTGADPVTLGIEAVTWSKQTNALYADTYLKVHASWLMDSAVLAALGKPVPPEPQRPLAVHWAWVDGWGMKASLGPDYVCDIPVPDVRISEVGKIDATVGGEVVGMPGHRYNLSNISSEGYAYISMLPTPRFWLLKTTPRSFNLYWSEVVPGATT